MSMLPDESATLEPEADEPVDTTSEGEPSVDESVDTKSEADESVDGEPEVEEPAAGPEAVPLPGKSPEDLAREQRKRRKVLLLILLAIIALLVAIAIIWYLVTRKPLSNLPGLGGDTPTYKFSIYSVKEPIGVAVTSSGDRVYVTNGKGGVSPSTSVLNGSGKDIGKLTPPASTGKMHMPTYVAVDPKTEDVYVSDRSTMAIYVYDKQDKYLRTFTQKMFKPADFRPLGLGFDNDGNLYVTNVAGAKHRIVVFKPDGTMIRELGQPGLTSFPNGIAVDNAGNTIVADSNNGRILFFDKRGGSSMQVLTSLKIGDTLFKGGPLIIFDLSGRPINEIGRGEGPGQNGLPRGAAFADGKLYIADTMNQRVQVYKIAGLSAGKKPTSVGSFGVEGLGDGQFEYPNGVAVDARSHVYVTDRANNRVQVWTY